MRNRRDLLKAISLLPVAASASAFGEQSSSHDSSSAQRTAGANLPANRLKLPKTIIKKVRAITTAPYGTG
ncbi:MAG: hypothetical protein ACYSQY_06230, partial [Planctomycetota bacterium]